MNDFTTLYYRNSRRKRAASFGAGALMSCQHHHYGTAVAVLGIGCNWFGREQGVKLRYHISISSCCFSASGGPFAPQRYDMMGQSHSMTALLGKEPEIGYIS